MHGVSSKGRTALTSAFILLTAGAGWAAPQAQAQTAIVADRAKSALVIPAGSTIQVELVRPVWARTASPGESIYAQTTFPVTLGNRVAVPPGSIIEGRLETLTRPTRRQNRSELQILFTHIILANGYVAELAGTTASVPNRDSAKTSSDTAPTATNSGGALIAVDVQVSRRNDLLLDNGAQIEITLAAPLMLDAAAVGAAIPLSHPPVPGQLKSASLCRTIPGSPGTMGTPDTVIPGSPGTSDTVIPGGPGMPDTVIPGTPATPSTVIPGTPGTPSLPDTPCPMPPVVLSSRPVNAHSS
jgi:hypothetical protein